MPKATALVLSDYGAATGAEGGGAGLIVEDSFRALRERGVDARLLTGFGSVGEGVGRRMSLNGGDLRAGGSPAAAIWNPAARQRLRFALRAHPPASTVVILHQWTRFLSPSAVALLAGYPLMIYMHDYFWACPNGAYYDFRTQRPCDRRPMGPRCLVARCDKEGAVRKAGRLARHTALAAATVARRPQRLCLHLSELARRTAAPLLPREAHAVVHNPLDVPAQALPAPREAPFDVGYFGRLEPEKGVGLLMDVVRRLGLRTLLAGQGGLGAPTDATIEHRRWQARDTMAAAMRSCRVVVLPSLWKETWGLIVPEAMAAGVPVLVSARAGAAELVARFGGGLVFDPGEPGDLEAKLRQMLGTDAAVWRPLDRPAFRRFLSPARHADHLVALAAKHWSLDVSGTADPLVLPSTAAEPQPA